MAAMLANIISLCTYLTRFGKNKLFRTHVRYKLPLPKTVHFTLDEEIIGNRKLLFIGDLHGCADELKELLNVVKSKYNMSDFLPIYVGDLVNKGPKSVETLHIVRQLEHFAVRGNHDDATLRHAIQLREVENYVPSPRYMPWVCELTGEDIDYLQELPYSISIPSFNALTVHAGLVPNVPLEKQTISDMIVMRNLTKRCNGSFKSSELPHEGEAWASLWPGPYHVYFGHDAIRKLQKHPYATGLDTGCVYGFQLTAVLVARDGSTEFFSVQAKEVYVEPNLTKKK